MVKIRMRRLAPIAIVAAGFVSLVAQQAPASSSRQVTQAVVERWMTELSNWGRWGKQDERGTLNLLTPETRRRAIALVKEGATVSCARDTDKAKAVDNSDPFVQEMNELGNKSTMPYAIDTYRVLYHGYAHTHIDSPGHLVYQGKIFNGFPASAITRNGLDKLSITNMKDGIVARAILMDIPRLKGVPYLEPGTPIYPEDLEAWEKKAGVHVGSGDIVLIRTGRWARRAAKGPWDVSKSSAGLYASCAEWLRKRDAAVLGSDAASDVAPSGVAGVNQPIHQLILVAMGMPILDNCDFEALSDAAARRNRWHFLLTVAPLRIPGGTGSPVNPIAVF